MHGRLKHGAVTHLASPRDHCLSPGRSAGAPVYADKYGRMFPGLAPLADEEELLLHIGSAGGVRDGGPLARQPGCDDAQIPAGSPFFGQFIAHDITAADLSAIVRGIDR